MHIYYGKIYNILQDGRGSAKGKMRKTLEKMVPAHYLEEFWEVFEKSKFDKLPEQYWWDHVIELKPGAEPFTSKVYPLNLDGQKCYHNRH